MRGSSRRLPLRHARLSCAALTLSGAVLGKVEGKGKLWHGHVTAVTVAPEFRRLGMARDLMTSLEDTTDE